MRRGEQGRDGPDAGLGRVRSGDPRLPESLPRTARGASAQTRPSPGQGRRGPARSPGDPSNPEPSPPSSAVGLSSEGAVAPGAPEHETPPSIGQVGAARLHAPARTGAHCPLGGCPGERAAERPPPLHRGPQGGGEEGRDLYLDARGAAARHARSPQSKPPQPRGGDPRAAEEEGARAAAAARETLLDVDARVAALFGDIIDVCRTATWSRGLVETLNAGFHAQDAVQNEFKGGGRGAQCGLSPRGASVREVTARGFPPELSRRLVLDAAAETEGQDAPFWLRERVPDEPARGAAAADLPLTPTPAPGAPDPRTAHLPRYAPAGAPGVSLPVAPFALSCAPDDPEAAMGDGYPRPHALDEDQERVLRRWGDARRRDRRRRGGRDGGYDSDSSRHSWASEPSTPRTQHEAGVILGAVSPSAMPPPPPEAAPPPPPLAVPPAAGRAPTALVQGTSGAPGPKARPAAGFGSGLRDRGAAAAAATPPESTPPVSALRPAPRPEAQEPDESAVELTEEGKRMAFREAVQAALRKNPIDEGALEGGNWGVIDLDGQACWEVPAAEGGGRSLRQWERRGGGGAGEGPGPGAGGGMAVAESRARVGAVPVRAGVTLLRCGEGKNVEWRHKAGRVSQAAHLKPFFLQMDNYGSRFREVLALPLGEAVPSVQALHWAGADSDPPAPGAGGGTPPREGACPWQKWGPPAPPQTVAAVRADLVRRVLGRRAVAELTARAVEAAAAALARSLKASSGGAVGQGGGAPAAGGAGPPPAKDGGGAVGTGALHLLGLGDDRASGLGQPAAGGSKAPATDPQQARREAAAEERREHDRKYEEIQRRRERLLEEQRRKRKAQDEPAARDGKRAPAPPRAGPSLAGGEPAAAGWDRGVLDAWLAEAAPAPRQGAGAGAGDALRAQLVGRMDRALRGQESGVSKAAHNTLERGAHWWGALKEHSDGSTRRRMPVKVAQALAEAAGAHVDAMTVTELVAWARGAPASCAGGVDAVAAVVHRGWGALVSMWERVLSKAAEIISSEEEEWRAVDAKSRSALNKSVEEMRKALDVKGRLLASALRA